MASKKKPKKLRDVYQIKISLKDIINELMNALILKEALNSVANTKAIWGGDQKHRELKFHPQFPPQS